VSSSSNFATSNVNHAAAGLYCISGLSFTPKGAQVTIDGNVAPHNDDLAQVEVIGVAGANDGACTGAGAPTPQVEVFVNRGSNSAADDSGFFIQFVK
jgi:hypothetical protein